MKKITLSSFALVTVLAIGAVTPVAVFAEDGKNDPEAAKSLGSTGTVEVQQGETGGGKPTDPEDPNVELPEEPEDVNTNPNTGPISIEKTTNLNFGLVKTSANVVKQFASPVVYDLPVKDKPGETVKANRGHFVQWADVRAGGVYGYTVTAELAQPFTGKDVENVLKSAQINFSNGLMNTQADNDNTHPTTPGGAFTIAEGAGAGKNAVTVVTADKAKKEGKGRYTMSFGKSNVDPEKDTTGKSVQLEIPAKTASSMAIDTYTAKITWKIVVAPEG